MSINNLNSDSTEEQKLEGAISFYNNLFRQMILEGGPTEGYTWRLGFTGKPRQVHIDNHKTKELTPGDLGIIALGLCLGDESNREVRIAHQYFLLETGIINHHDIMLQANKMIKVTRPEHASTRHYVTHMVENAGKIVLLRRAYGKLQGSRNEGGLNDLEDRIILGYVVSLLGGRYELRPYMIDNDLKEDSWVDFYDHLFQNFSQQSYEIYKSAGYENLWISFLEIRDDIACKKGNPTLRELMIQRHNEHESEKLLHAFLQRIRTLTLLPPNSNFKQKPQPPEDVF